MRQGLWLAAMLLPLAGCYVPPPDPPAYAQPAYPPPPPYGYPPPGYPPAPYGNVYPGYSYNDGSPTMFVEGATVPLIFFGGAWGYYDGRHNWHRAPDEVGRHIEEQREHGGRPYGRPDGGPNEGRPQGGRPGGAGGFIPANAQGRPPAAEPRPSSPQHEEHQHRHDCPPGQRC